MNEQNIPELAEQIRHHINTDNAAKRLICEHILPLVGINVNTVTEMEELAETPENYDRFVKEIGGDLDHLLKDFADLEREEILAELKRIRGTFA
jgi:hypothetical protein